VFSGKDVRRRRLGTIDALVDSDSRMSSQFRRHPNLANANFPNRSSCRDSRHETAPDVGSILPADTAAWAIFGPARHWFPTPDRILAEKMAAKIETR
jgi:hypothetical protein